MGRRREAIPHSVLCPFRDHIVCMATKMARLHPLQLTHEELLDLAAPKEHHEILREAAAIAAIDTDKVSFEIKVPHATFHKGTATVAFRFNDIDGKDAPLSPRHPIYFRSPKTEATRERIAGWIDNQLEVSREFGIVRAALDILATKCNTREEVRFLFPSVLALCADVETNNEVAMFHESIVDFVTPRHLPALTPTERKLIREAAGYVAAAALVNDSEENTSVPEVSVELESTPHFSFNELNVARSAINY